MGRSKETENFIDNSETEIIRQEGDMENYIIIASMIVIVAIAVRSTVKHFKGQGGCCGGGDYKPKKKKFSKILYKKTFKVGGMHCEHCKNRVEEAVNDIKGVAGKVNLKKGELIVSYAAEVEDKVIISKIEKAGYTYIQ